MRSESFTVIDMIMEHACSVGVTRRANPAYKRFLDIPGRFVKFMRPGVV